MVTLKGKVALVTGASRGIGRAIAQRLAKEGALVVVHYGSNAKAAGETMKAIEKAGGSAFAIKAELTDMAEIARLFQIMDAELMKRTGSNRFDILVNNAGVAERGFIQNTSEELFDRHFAINVKGLYFLTKQALERLKNGARIINISTAAVRVGMPDNSSYIISKAAVNSLTLTLAKQLGKQGITVNTIAPGVTDTEMAAGALDEKTKEFLIANTALGRIGTPEDIAGVAAFLVSEDGRWVTAQCIEASGGVLL